MPAPDTRLAFNEKQLQAILSTVESHDNAVFLESSLISEENHRSFLFVNPVQLLLLERDQEPGEFFRQAEQALAAGYYLAGWFCYELGYLLEPRLKFFLKNSANPKGKAPLAVLGLFPPPLVFDHLKGECIDLGGAGCIDTGGWGFIDTSSTGCIETGNEPCEIYAPSLNISQQEYRQAITSIHQAIADGESYQVNYTFKQRFRFTGSLSGLYKRLRKQQPVSYSGLLKLAGQQVLSFSPELFFRKQNNTCITRPMKGTCPRGDSPAEDARLAARLASDPKNRSENVMIVDLLRNDLGRVCQPGGVVTSKLFQVERYPTLHQMTSTVEGRLKKGAGIAEMLTALFPCGSVSGAPKIRSMEIIHALEKEERGVYTGAIGYISPQREMVFNVPIRTIEIFPDNRASMGIGSGIVYDSQPDAEWDECLLKSEFVSKGKKPVSIDLKNLALFETILWQEEKGYWLLELHLQRLAGSAAELGIALCLKAAKEKLTEAASGFNGDQRVRLMLNTDGGISLSASPIAKTRRYFDWPLPPPAPAPQALALAERPEPGLSLSPSPAMASAIADDKQLTEPLVCISEQTTDPDWPLIYHKSTQRQLYDKEREKALAAGYFEVLFTNNRGELSEGAISNIFVELAEGLYTPPIKAGLLNGVLRQHLLKTSQAGLKERSIHKEELKQAKAVYIGNSLRGLTRVRVETCGGF